VRSEPSSIPFSMTSLPFKSCMQTMARETKALGFHNAERLLFTKP
jgi:hypothetical protein